jgi:hypothetical protein
VAEVGPLVVSAHNAEQAEYIVRSRAEQRGIRVSAVAVDGGSAGSWTVTVTVDDEHGGAAADLGEDTQVLHFNRHRTDG